MRRTIEEAIAGIALVISFVGMFWFIRLEMTTSNDGYVIAALMMGALCLISIFALVTFSRSGWSLEGSPGEWLATAYIDPTILILNKNTENEDAVTMERKNQRSDDEYWNRRK